MPPSTMIDVRSQLPGLDRLLAEADVSLLSAQWGRRIVAAEARSLLADLRHRMSTDSHLPDLAAIISDLTARLERIPGRGPRPVWNLTGTVIHTNLGRAPLPEAAIAAMAEAASCSDVEFDLIAGRRGNRDQHIERLICDLTGAEAATVVNNNAAAVLLLLNTFAEGKAVPVSRGELVEIGGSFRMPDIMSRAGCRLVEVGTTNRTRRSDFEAAIDPDTGMLLKVHPSNYAIAGFHEEVAIAELATLAQAHGLPLAWDLGSGSLVDLSRFGLGREPMPSDALKAGADLVCFSGDKLLGGPQAGIIVGRREAVEALRRNPLKRALRVDKITLAALAAVLRIYGDEANLPKAVPVLRLISRPRDEIALLAERLRGPFGDRLGADWQVESIELASQIGSGALPVASLDSAGLVIQPRRTKGRGAAVEGLQQRLRQLSKPIIGRIAKDSLILDLRCVEDESALIRTLEGFHRP